jgi:hypothetical protein
LGLTLRMERQKTRIGRRKRSWNRTKKLKHIKSPRNPIKERIGFGRRWFGRMA